MAFFQAQAYLMFGLFSKSLYSKIQNFKAFLKTDFGLFQLQVAGNPGAWRQVNDCAIVRVSDRRSWSENVERLDSKRMVRN